MTKVTSKRNGKGLIPISGGKLVEFRPDLMLEIGAKLSAVRQYAESIRDWELLDEAVDAMLGMQGQFVEWWGAAVSVRHGPGGVDRAKNADRRSLLSVAIAEEKTGVSQQTVSKWRKRLADADAYRDFLRGPAYRRAFGMKGTGDVVGALGTGNQEWYTPAQYLDLVRQVFGGEIDLDPASNKIAQKTVKAVRWFSKADDGLKQEWGGRVFLNPPYSQPFLQEFVFKMCDDYLAGRISAGILLTHNYTDTNWFRRSAAACSGWCFTSGRVKFEDAKGNPCAPTQGQAFHYFGEELRQFADVFSAVGFIAAPLR